ncbi:hypothetical protein BDZ85DRAFT_8841 [Elsinoe ampelina]|uniref:Zn(2)-C6 fungal-type domain-containing protein n=1 Tax=Elsinoe ampelina TaxID=302913 RepID=A0A6A6GQD0_9PEZI|nr:hypothetical protein BDZ85DRAFT_8841 [Elsinoe ampelina]
MDHHISRPAEQHPRSLPSISTLNPPSRQSPTQPSPHPPQPPHSHYPPPGPAHPYHHPSSYGPPQSHYVPPSARPERAPEHGHAGEGSGHATPVNRQPPEYPGHPPQRTPSTPSQPPSSASMRSHPERPNEGPQHAPPPPSYHHEGPPPPQGPPPPGYYHPHPPQHVPPPHAEAGAAPQHHMVEQGHYGMQHPPHYAPVMYAPYGPPAPPGKKKSNRASQACDRCRERKSKCDEQHPCATCHEQGVECKYRESQTTKGLDKGAPPQLLNTIHDIVEHLPDTGKEILDKLSRLEELLNAQAASRELSREPKREEIARRDTPTAEAMSRVPSSAQAQSLHREASSHGARHEVNPAIKSETEETEEVPDFDDHTTAAHKLLYLWPSINKLFDWKDRGKLKYNYVVNGEARGWLRLDGAGETQKPTELGAFDSDTEIEGASPPDLWDGATDLPSDPKGVYVSEPARLDLKEETVRRLLGSYCEHIHILHPFLDMPTLLKFLPTFIKRHASPDARTAMHSPLQGVNGDNSRSKKRGRDGQLIADSPAIPTPRMSNERSLPVAITYLVLALGKICEYQGMVPGPLADDPHVISMPPPSNVLYSGSPTATSRPSPASTAVSYNASTPSSVDARAAGQSPQSIHDSPGPGMSRRIRNNHEHIPGLKYYREACAILGLFSDSNELAAAQAKLLAGLYKGQLGRVQESWSWIHDACRICRYQLRMNNLDKGVGSQHPRRYPIGSKKDIFENTLLVVCWSALQLESDILAELDYPHSGLAALQSSLPLPRKALATLDGYDFSRALEFYHKQLFLRSRLNEMHAEIYGRNMPSLPPERLADLMHLNLSTLEGFRGAHRWEDPEGPASDILEVRLRAKYYGAQYIHLRPYLDYVLHAMNSNNASGKPGDMARDAYDRPRKNESHYFAAIATMRRDIVIERSGRCVQSAIRSTIAFDGLKGRLIVTNIVGTSHAQFSNMLVLAACYQSGIDFLVELISEQELKRLFERTVRFLANLRYCSPTANQDIQYLQMIHRRLFNRSVPAPPAPPAGSLMHVDEDWRGQQSFHSGSGYMSQNQSFESNT